MYSIADAPPTPREQLRGIDNKIRERQNRHNWTTIASGVSISTAMRNERGPKLGLGRIDSMILDSCTMPCLSAEERCPSITCPASGFKPMANILSESIAEVRR